MRTKIPFLIAMFLLSASIFLVGQTRDVGEFNAVHSSTSVTVTLVKASAPSIEYKMKKGSEKDLITKVKNGKLYVKTKSNKGSWGNSTEADVTVYYTNLEEIKASAGCTVKTDNAVKSKTMEIEVSSGSTAKLEIEADEVEVDVSSGATLKLKGEAEKGNFEASSGSTLNAYHFVTDDAVVEASSGASLSIHVDKSLEATAGSGASISYAGDVKNKNIDEGWSGSIKRKKK